MTIHNAQEYITQKIQRWTGLTIHPHRFGGTEYRLGKREIGHIHGKHLVDIPFPTKVRHEIVETGLAEPHHILKESGWVSPYLRGSEDVERAIALLQRSFELAQRKWADQK